VYRAGVAKFRLINCQHASYNKTAYIALLLIADDPFLALTCLGRHIGQGIEDRSSSAFNLPCRKLARKRARYFF
jgi:hypothetical protein